MTRTMISAGLALLLLAGCGSLSMIRQTQEPSWLYKSPSGTELLLTTCDGITRAECEQLQPIEFTKDAADREAWHHEARVEVKAAVGISYGRMPVDWYVVGPREACERFRAKVEQERKIPTAPCQGPVYFRAKTYRK